MGIRNIEPLAPGCQALNERSGRYFKPRHDDREGEKQPAAWSDGTEKKDNRRVISAHERVATGGERLQESYKGGSESTVVKWEDEGACCHPDLLLLGLS